jgi:transposase
MNTKLHAVTDANGRPLRCFMTAGQISDHIGAAALLDELPKAQWLLGDRAHRARVENRVGNLLQPRSRLGSGLIGHSQKMMVAASAMAEKKAVGQRS